jgi:hypothetical protein
MSFTVSSELVSDLSLEDYSPTLQGWLFLEGMTMTQPVNGVWNSLTLKYILKLNVLHGVSYLLIRHSTST